MARSAPSEHELYSMLDDCKSYDFYKYRIEDGFTFMGMGIAGPIFLFQTYDFSWNPVNWRKNIRIMSDGYRICGSLGVNMRVVDDLMDGDAMTQVQDRESLWDNYIESLKKGEMPEPIETEDEMIAYRAGQILHNHYNEEVIEELINHIHNLKDLLKEEDKSTEEGYRRYAEGFGGEYGKTLLTALKNIESFNPTKQNYEFVNDYGLATQIADDRFDDDIGLDKSTEKEIYEEYLKRLISHNGLVPQLIGRTGLHVPQIYNFLMFSGRVVEKIKP